MIKEKFGLYSIVLLSLLAISVVLFIEPIPQDTNYHHFHDIRMFLGVPNFWNVLSNLPFFFAGLWGVHWISKANNQSYIGELKLAYFILFAGIAMVGLGSAYYHLWPDNNTLVWDRLPMTIAFMALFSIIIAEFISIRIGKFLLLPLLIAGMFSVYYWHYSEVAGQGDLRLYILVQFLPMILIPLILLVFESRFTHRRAYWLLLLAYLIAKVLEHFDSETFELIPVLSGHTVKHLVAAFGVYLLVRAYRDRVKS